MNKVQMASIIKSFGVTFTLERKVGNHREHGQTVANEPSEPVTLSEPIMPMAQGNSPAASGHSSAAMFMVNGQLEQADLVWYSNVTDVPIDSIVTLHDHRYKVVATDDWSDFSDVKIYYLKGLEGYVVKSVQDV